MCQVIKLINHLVHLRFDGYDPYFAMFYTWWLRKKLMGGPGRESYLIINRYINLEFLHNNGPQNNQHLPCELPYFACKFLAKTWKLPYIIQRLLIIIQVTAPIEVGMSLHFVNFIFLMSNSFHAKFRVFLDSFQSIFVYVSNQLWQIQR